MLSMATVKEKEIPKKDPTKTGCLKKCFSAIVDRKQVNLDIEAIKIILKNELSINLESLEKQLSVTLPYMLVLYIKTWPGWQRSKEFYSGKLNFRDWYEKFRQYIVIKMNYMIRNGYNLARKMMQEETVGVVKENAHSDKSSLTDRNIETAPYSITINCTAKMMNSLIFLGHAEHIKLRTHAIVPWTVIGIRELLNWPYIGIEFSSPELCFKRVNSGEYNRYLSLKADHKVKQRDYIEHVSLIDNNNCRHCYSYNMIQCYMNEYLNILESVQNMPSSFVENISYLFQEFLTDIEEIGMNKTMATNTSVLFNIGGNTYTRYKKYTDEVPYMNSSMKEEVNLCEEYTPKMETSLLFFKGVQDLTTPQTSFIYLNIVKDILKNGKTIEVLGHAYPAMLFSCQFCNLKFNTTESILGHVTVNHCMEPNFFCGECKQPTSVSILSKSRWKHDCKRTTAAEQQK